MHKQQHIYIHSLRACRLRSCVSSFSCLPNPGATNLCFNYGDCDLFMEIVERYELGNEIFILLRRNRINYLLSSHYSRHKLYTTL